jgi:hypothetical protein
MSVAEYFSPDYASARERFRSAAARAAAATVSHMLPDLRGPAGEMLSLDVARLGAADAQSALLVIAGTHGVEGLAGSGCLVGLLEDRLHDALPATGCLMLLHAINPHGFAWLRRVTEDGVDLNRNFVDFSQPLPSSQPYEPLHDWLVPKAWEGEIRQAADAALGAHVQKHGMAALQAAVSSGQYTRPGGLFYGGVRETWSAQMLLRTLREGLPPTVRRLAVLDLHTGLGPSAYGELILDAADPTARERALRWYGPDVRDLSSGESVSSRLTGTMARGIERARPELELTFVAIEFGTRPVMEVLTALRADHWLHSHGGDDPAAATRIRRQMRDAFYTDTAPWRAAVYGRTADLAFRALRGLGA